MRKSERQTGARPFRVGLAVAAAAVTVVAGTATPAFAADVAVTLDVNAGPLGGGNTIEASGTGVLTSITAPGARFITPDTAACPATYGTASTGSINATATRDDDDTVDIIVPAVTPLGTAYRVCIYASTATSAAIAGHATDGEDYTVSAGDVTLTPNAAPPGTTPAVAAGVGPFLTGITAPASLFTTAASCPATYSATGAVTTSTSKNSASTQATITVPNTLTQGLTYRTCIYTASTASGALIATGSYSVVPAGTVSPNVGPDLGTNTIIVTSASNFLTNANTTPGAIFTRGTCPNVNDPGADDVAAATVSRVTNNRVAVTVPAGVALEAGELSAAYKVCVYSDTAATATLVVQPMTYTIATAVTVTSITPDSGPAQGGQQVVITGADFPTAAGAEVTVSIGGSPLADVRVISPTEITGVTTAHAAGTTAVAVTTLAGTTTETGLYEYTFGLTVVPNTAQPESEATLYVTGAGFSDITWDTAPYVSDGAVLLVPNLWYREIDDGTDDAVDADTAATTVCEGPITISDTELLCTLDLGSTLAGAYDGSLDAAVNVPTGTYNVAVVTDLADTTLTTAQYSNISSGATFTVSEY